MENPACPIFREGLTTANIIFLDKTILLRRVKVYNNKERFWIGEDAKGNVN